MRDINKIITMVMVLTLALVPFIVLDDGSDAASDFNCGEMKITKSFDDMSGGTIMVPVENKTNDLMTVTITVKDTSSKKLYAGDKFEITANGETECKLSWNFGSSGDKRISVSVSNGSETETFERTISVEHSIWKDPVTYIAIVVAIIIIAIMIFIKMRSNTDAKAKEMKGKKEEKIFTKMAEEKKNSKVESKPSNPVSLEKKTYDGSKRNRRK